MSKTFLMIGLILDDIRTLTGDMYTEKNIKSWFCHTCKYIEIGYLTFYSMHIVSFYAL